MVAKPVLLMVMTGVGTFNVNVSLDTAELCVSRIVMALTVVGLVVRSKGPVYSVLLAVGVLPSVV